MLDLNQIALFVDVMNSRSFAATARRSGRPPNFVRRHVHLLESALDNRLFHRFTRKLTLTAAGQALFAPLEECDRRLGGATAASIDDPTILSGTVRAAAPNGFFEFFPLDRVAQFPRRSPACQTRICLE